MCNQAFDDFTLGYAFPAHRAPIPLASPIRIAILNGKIVMSQSCGHLGCGRSLHSGRRSRDIRHVTAVDLRQLRQYAFLAQNITGAQRSGDQILR